MCTLFIFSLLFLKDISLGQVYKFPFLIQHFTEHRQRDYTVSIADFFSMHYWGEDIQDNDSEKDMQLPFKEMKDLSSVQPFIPFVKTFVLRPLLYLTHLPYPLYKESFLPNPQLASLFRPPINSAHI